MAVVSRAPAEDADRVVETEHRVTELELFFDLVFVFAITQITSMLADDTSWRGLLRGLLVLGAVWWAWEGFAWLTNSLDAEADRVRLVTFAAMGAMLLVALATPGAFDDDAWLFGGAYLAFRLLHLALYVSGAKDPDVRRAVERLAPSALLASGLILAAAAFDGAAQGALWCAALAVDYGWLIGAGVAGWRVHAGHFAERHGLIVIIALGESIVAIGVGTDGIGLDAPVVAAALLGVVITTGLWWAYFDVVAPVAARRLRAADRETQTRIARDSYTLLHLPMIAGIVLLALGLKKTLGHVDAPLADVPAAALCGGAALYLLALVAFRLRNLGTLNRQRLVAAVVLLALAPVATTVDALVAVTLVAAVLATLTAFEALRFREARARIRAAA
jgi:low temperature requirement protein LtrA